MISIADAKNLINSELFVPEKIFINIQDARNYILAEDIFADRDYPPFNRAAVDGYAVRFSDIDSGIKTFHIGAEVFSGDAFNESIERGHCIKIMTGAAVPEGFDILFMVEHCEETAGVVAIPEQELTRGLNIARQGENIRKGQMIFQKGTLVDERAVHSLAAIGLHSVPVFSLPKVKIISTGSEIVAIDQTPGDFQIRDSNYYGLLFHLAKLNIHPSENHILKDTRVELRDGLSMALDSDLLLVTGGVSMGDRDFIPEVLDQLGVENIFHHVNIKPGKPLWFGRYINKESGRRTFVFALPGNPLSTLVSYKIFIEPWLYASLKRSPSIQYNLPIARERFRKGNRAEYFPVKINSQPGKISNIEPMKFHGSGDITATAGSDGLAFHPSEYHELEKGQLVEFIPWN